MERGVGKWFYQSMVDHVDAFEAVLADGDAIAGRVEGSGPRLWGLIPQNNIAVVTRLTFRLESFPVWRQQITCALPDASALEAALERLRPELQRGARMHLEFINDYRLAAQLAPFPYATFDGAEPLPREWIAENWNFSRAARWFCGATVWGDEDAALSIERTRLARAFADIGAALEYSPPIAGSAPTPDNEGLRCAYWRKRSPMPRDPDPDRDRCGVIWIAPELPMSGGRAREIVGVMEAIMLEHRFEPALSIRVVDARALRIVAGLLYDRDTPGDDARAADCRRALQARLAEAGVQAYRRGVLDGPPRGDVAADRLRAAIKATADPAGILAPGRYESAAP
jgi:4-cresol dehydrogenase (hydroxylating)